MPAAGKSPAPPEQSREQRLRRHKGGEAVNYRIFYSGRGWHASRKLEEEAEEEDCARRTRHRPRERTRSQEGEQDATRTRRLTRCGSQKDTPPARPVPPSKLRMAEVVAQTNKVRASRDACGVSRVAVAAWRERHSRRVRRREGGDATDWRQAQDGL